MLHSTKLLVTLVLAVNVLYCHCASTRVTFPGCDRNGWKCLKVQTTPIRYLIEYVCQTPDINFVLWNFNAPAEIRDLRFTNCSSVEIDLTCTNVGRMIESLHILNVGTLNFTNILYKDWAQLPEKVNFENIKNIPLIPEKTFKQMKYPPASSYRCAVNTKPVDTITFNNVRIGTIQKDAFHNMTEVKIFNWDNVRVNTMEPLAVKLEMEKDKMFKIINSSFKKLDYKALAIRSPDIQIIGNSFQEFPRNVIDATSFKFDFKNNTIEKVHSFAIILLSQDITIQYNNFTSMKTSALQGIGPGLLENAFMSFGQLKFTYNFNNNTILHSDIGGLNPDWIAYKNVRSYVNAGGNYLPCSCKELGWITLRGGLGDEFSEMMTFNAKYLDKTNHNLCLNAPCSLPVTVMTGMHITFGQCGATLPLASWCKKYNPRNTIDYGLGKSAKVVLNKWQNDFPAQQSNTEEQSSEDLDELERIFELSLKTEDVYSDPQSMGHKYINGKQKESFFKIEKTSFQNGDSSTALPNNIIEAIGSNVYNATVVPDIYFDENDTLSENSTELSYNMDIRNGMKDHQNVTHGSSQHNIDRKEFDDGQKNFLKESYNQWQAARKKRMVYFKVYGNMMTVE
ncbi:hypothetical protein CBL_00202 [Carabus blaptoides fortunei]